MKKTGIFYGSTTGNTELVAHTIAENLKLAHEDVYDVAKSSPSDVAPYDVLIFGCSTWGDGDMQEDMHDFLDGVAAMDHKGKKIALFGCGDDTMSETFCNGVGEMYRMLQPTGAEFFGDFNTDGYEYDHTSADVDGKTVGLLIDNMNHEKYTADRIGKWVKELDLN